MIGGVILDDLCPDGNECILDAAIWFNNAHLFRIEDRTRVAGKNFSYIMVSQLVQDLPNENWKEVSAKKIERQSAQPVEMDHPWEDLEQLDE